MRLSKISNKNVTPDAGGSCTRQKIVIPLQQKIKKGIIMGLLNDYSGIGMSPRPRWEHQETLMKCIHRAYDELEEQGLQIVPEVTVTNDWNDKAPDLVIFDSYHNPLSIIEITTHKECYEIIEKCEELMERFPESEYFVYDYERFILYAYDRIEGDWISSADYEITSQYLDRPVRDYLS